MRNSREVYNLVEEVYLGVHLQSSSHTFETMLEMFKNTGYYLGMIHYDSDFYEYKSSYNEYSEETEYEEKYKFGDCMYRTVFDLLWFNYGEKIIPYIKPYFNKDSLKSPDWVNYVLLKKSVSIFMIYNDIRNINSVENKSRLSMVKFLNDTLSREELDEVMLSIMSEKINRHFETREIIFNMNNIFNKLNISDDIFFNYVYYETDYHGKKYYNIKHLSVSDITSLFSIPQLSKRINEIASETLNIFYNSKIYLSRLEFTEHLCKFVTNIDLLKDDSLKLKILARLLS